MSAIDTIDLEEYINNTITNVFDTMLSMQASPVEAGMKDDAVARKGPRIVGSVGLSGDVMGNISIQVSDVFAREITAAMLGMEEEEIESDEEVHDVIGEISNMVGGDLKSRLCDVGFPCSLSIPSITSGTDFKIESTGWSRHEQFALACDGHSVVIEVFIRPGG